MAPLTPDRYRVQFTVSTETYDKLQRAQNLLCREIPDGDPAAIFDRALDLLLIDVEKKRLAATKNPFGRFDPSVGRNHSVREFAPFRNGAGS